jgi:type II secretory pathway component GspD/PulD (secretin)
VKKLFYNNTNHIVFKVKGKKGKLLTLVFLLGLLSFNLLAAEAPSLEIQEKLKRPVSLDLRNMNVVDVYRFLAMKGDFNISISKNISGRVTLFMNNVLIEDALEIISIANDLGYRIMGKNIVHVMTEAEFLKMFGEKFGDKRNVTIVHLKYAKPAYVLEALKNVKSEIGKIVIDEDSGSVVMIDTDKKIKEMKKTIDKIDHPLETKIYNLQYANAEDIANQLKRKIDNKAVGSVQADQRSNQLVVRALPGRIAEVEQIIKALDEKTKAVRIAARILKIVFNPRYDKGVEWPEALSLKKEGTSLTETAKFISTYSGGDITIDEFQMKLNLSKQISDTKVLANPTITVVNNQEAKIHIGDVLAYVTTTTLGTGDDKEVNEEVHFLDVGVQLSVTPTINEDNFITMKIKPQISSQSGTLKTPQGAEIPLINSTRVETEVIAKDSETIVIGGLRKDDIIRTQTSVPYLSDIPILGSLFSNDSNEEQNTEIVILLTPHVITGSENAVSSKRKRKDIKTDKQEAVELNPQAINIMPDKTVH